jgi:hypothetical protein
MTSNIRCNSLKIATKFYKRFPDIHGGFMRTTVDIEEDVLLAAKEIARQRGKTLGRVLSDLARQSLTRKSPTSDKHGLQQFPIQPDAGVVTTELVNQLRDELP